MGWPVSGWGGGGLGWGQGQGCRRALGWAHTLAGVGLLWLGVSLVAGEVGCRDMLKLLCWEY